MFSENWHQVANERIWLRPSVQVRKQMYRGEAWYVVHDPFSNRFVRLRPEAYAFLARMDEERTVGEVWEWCLERDASKAPTQGEAIQLLAQLYQTNLIRSDVSPDSKRLFERQRKVKQRELVGMFSSVLFIRIPLWDPERFLRATQRFVVPVFFNKLMALVWLVVVGYGLKMVADHWEEAVARTEGVLDPANVPMLFVSFFVIKFIHELGHAYAVKKYGGEVHTMGIMLLVFSPVPYVDATAAWAFRERARRVFVGAGGMIVEFFLAAIAAVVWANTGDGTVHAVAYNVMFAASVTTLLFNINPLLRFDGYYILSDLTDTPNLQQRSVKRIYYLIEKYLFKVEKTTDPARSAGEGVWLVVFGVASWLYRMFIFSVIILFVADKYFGLGMIAAVVGFLGLFVLPVIKYVKYLGASPRLMKARKRAVWVTVGAVAVLVILLGVVPFPNHFRAPGVVLAAKRSEVVAETNGYAVRLGAKSAVAVEAGEMLVTVENRDLETELTVAESQVRRVEALGGLALASSSASIVPVEKMRDSVDKDLAELERQKASQKVLAPMAGVWAAPRIEALEGMWVDRGVPFGEVIDTSAYEFHVVVSQRDASRFFAAEVDGVEVRFPGEAGDEVGVVQLRVVPGQQSVLPYKALGWGGGGPVETAADDTTGAKAAEAFFLVVLELAGAEDAAVLHHRTGVARFDLRWQPLMVQWVRSFRQLLQERFGV